MILATVFVVGAAFQAWWGIVVLSNIWGYRDSTIETYVTVGGFLYAIGAVFLAAAIAMLAPARRTGWLVLALLLAAAAVVPYWLWVDNLKVSYANNIAFGLLAVIALMVHALTRPAAPPA